MTETGAVVGTNCLAVLYKTVRNSVARVLYICHMLCKTKKHAEDFGMPFQRHIPVHGNFSWGGLRYKLITCFLHSTFMLKFDGDHLHGGTSYCSAISIFIPWPYLKGETNSSGFSYFLWANPGWSGCDLPSADWELYSSHFCGISFCMNRDCVQP